MNRRNWHLSCSLTCWWNPASRSYSVLGAEVRNHHLPFPGASSQWTRHGGRAIFAAQTRRAVFSPDKLLSLCFLFGLVFGGGWGHSWCLAFVLFCFVVLLGGSGFLLLLWEVMTNLHANGFLVKIWVLKIIFPSSKHFKTYFGLRKDKGMEEERSTSSLCY